MNKFFAIIAGHSQHNCCQIYSNEPLNSTIDKNPTAGDILNSMAILVDTQYKTHL
jgi:hypothetical protein